MTHEEKSDLIRELRAEVERLKAQLREYQQQGVNDLLRLIDHQKNLNSQLETVINSSAYHDGVSAQAEIKRLKDLIGRAADALECFIDYPLPFVAELRKAAE